MALLKRLDLGNLVWHFFNPRLPDVEGDYTGLSGLRTFFESQAEAASRIEIPAPVSI